MKSWRSSKLIGWGIILSNLVGCSLFQTHQTDSILNQNIADKSQVPIVRSNQNQDDTPQSTHIQKSSYSIVSIGDTPKEVTQSDLKNKLGNASQPENRSDREIHAGIAEKGLQELPHLEEFSIDHVLQLVLERNPNIQQMLAAAQAVHARYNQVTSLDDPTFSNWTAPGTIWSNQAYLASRTELSQKIPYRGKLKTRGEIVLAEGLAANEEVADIRLQFIQATRFAYADYYAAERELEVNSENQKLLQSFYNNAKSRYQTGKGQQQDVLQAEVEIAKLQQQQITLERIRIVAQAQLNTLMHVPTDTPLPRTPRIIEPLPIKTEIDLQKLALQQRPDIRALKAKLQADQGNIKLARLEFKPDFEWMGAYDSFWQGSSQSEQWQLGVRMNLPIRLARRNAVLSEAEAKYVEKFSQLIRLQDVVKFQVTEALAQLTESDRNIEIFEKKLLPAARANVKEAQPAYTTGGISFIALVQAQRSYIDTQEKYYDALAERARRQANMERVLGGFSKQGIK